MRFFFLLLLEHVVQILDDNYFFFFFFFFFWQIIPFHLRCTCDHTVHSFVNNLSVYIHKKSIAHLPSLFIFISSYNEDNMMFVALYFPTYIFNNHDHFFYHFHLVYIYSHTNYIHSHITAWWNRILARLNLFPLNSVRVQIPKQNKFNWSPRIVAKPFESEV